MKNTLKTKEEVLAVVNSYIAHFEYYHYRIPADYEMSIEIIDESIHWRIRFEWVYKITHLDLGDYISSTSSDSFIWLKGEDFINLFLDIDRMIEIINKDEIEIIPFKG